jgi:hypothetical protein
MPTLTDTTTSQAQDLREDVPSKLFGVRISLGKDRGKDRAARARSLPYLRALCWTFVLLYLLPWCLIRWPELERWLPSVYGPTLDYAYATAGLNADVLLVGDSSLILGIDPSRMARELHLKVIALPNTIGSLRADGEMSLQRYLHANRAPRLIVLYVNPWNLDYSHIDDGISFYEGEEMMLRHGHWKDIEGWARQHPFGLLKFPFTFYVANLESAIFSWKDHRHPIEETRSTGGHYDALYKVAPYDLPCTMPKAKTREIPMDSAREFLEEYTRPGTKTMVFNAPVPSCQGAGLLTGRSYAAVGAAPPKLMSAHDFKGDPFYAHPEPSGVPQATDNLTDAVREALAR